MDDDDFEFGARKNRNAKTGRRARKAEEEAVADEAEETMTVDSAPTRDADAPPRPSRRMGGWGDDSKAKKNSGEPPQGRKSTLDEMEDERLRPRTPQEQDSDEDIPVIPDLEDNQEEDLSTQIAVAPNVAVNRVATYRELDNDLLRHHAFLNLDNEIDLKLLTKWLSSEQDVHEEDKPWDWDRLFTEVSSELLSEWERKDHPEEDEILS